jgi:outer membrane protein assembly factor BamB
MYKGEAHGAGAWTTLDSMRIAQAAVVALATTLTAILTACGTGTGTGTVQFSGSPPANLTAPAAQANGASAFPASTWPTFHQNPARTGTVTGLPTAGHLSSAWQTHLDGNVYGQPLVVGNEVIAATENDSLYALNKSTGSIIWRTHVATPVPLSALPCGNINPLGITGTPVYDQANGLVYAVAETTGYHHVLFGFQVTDGKVKVERDIPAPDKQPRYDQQRGALTIEAGRVYVAFGGLYGDCGPYVGSVVGIPLSGSGALVDYRVPTSREGGIWGTAGPVAGTDGTLYISVGNGSVTSTQFDGSDSVTALSPSLKQTGIFAPAGWHEDNVNDRDLGSASPVLLANGRLLALGKPSAAYLLNSARLGGVGGQLAETDACAAYGAASVDGTTVYEPCDQGGMAAISVAGDQVRVLWRGPASAAGSPVVGGGAVWVTDYATGTLYEVNPATGAVRDEIGLGGALPHFASPTLAGSLVYVGTDDGVSAIRGA